VISTPIVVGFAAFVVAVLALAALALVVLVVADLSTGWTPRPRPRHRAEDRSPGVQFWARSTDADTVSIPVIDVEGRRVA
jgi:hypothetical protein